HGWSTTRRSAAASFRTLCCFARAASFQLLCTTAIFIDAHRDVAQNAIVDAHAAFKLGDLTARAFDLDEHKRAVFVVQDFVGQLPFAHGLGLDHHATLIGYDLREALGEFRHFVVGCWVYYEDHFVLSLRVQNQTSSKGLLLISLIKFA